MTNRAASPLSFNGTGVEFLYGSSAAHSTFTYSIDGSEPVSIDVYSSPATLNKHTTVTGLSAGDHILTITKSNDDQYVSIIGAYELKGTKGIRLNRCGLYGAKIAAASYISVNGDAPLYQEIDYWNPPLTIIAMIANDFQQQTALSAYKASMQTVITRAKQYGDVMLVSYCPLDESELTITIPFADYNNTLKDLAEENDCCFVDLASRWGSTFQTDLMNNYVHPNTAGHRDIGDELWKVLISE